MLNSSTNLNSAIALRNKVLNTAARMKALDDTASDKHPIGGDVILKDFNMTPEDNFVLSGRLKLTSGQAFYSMNTTEIDSASEGFREQKQTIVSSKPGRRIQVLVDSYENTDVESQKLRTDQSLTFSGIDGRILDYNESFTLFNIS